VKSVTVRCPAKVNLFLAVGPSDATGYHPVRTILQAVSIFDTLAIESSETPGLTCNWPDLPVDDSVSKALRLLGEITRVPSLHIHLHKEIPAESGLGGASTDAAGLLRGIGAFLEATLPRQVLLDIAAAIGVDTPFFLVGGRARGEGYGERLTPMPDAPPLDLVVAKPAVGVASGEAYRRLDSKSFAWRDWPADETLYNDFERVAPCESLDLIERLRALGARDAGLTGSGSAVFGVFADSQAAGAAAARLASEGADFVRACRTLTRTESLT